ncbi:undecaprenyl pyrophosphate synthetase [Candidatus Blochmanniella floridana]|uniref:Ditrans,polycis-undecaprenyl-diphosphate synthase ((2E,6E)-farnesyl-diphosphate specific) n=1 Tax=Blochmanniella floridana TaxID=203907 RepID=UPPS_BLOFL|nr:RecName: Full=Ditrans,polycis-undecaprenyl-diphosphate synthase ((2E,6E)-farnesyl-diphosphate specific); AltName: Full=Ditrans,polycis-undecaprenylcistransferase; AltName: Full=Undecaprenyl diphosphate synthase; Short=UDS; AltName: Full=Undecaprenyl pyrophosphate synthase; Short=UPP synthase [Candidatus Blochmannia floridanus]CAD83347.1 undecaprenyl pyrophosphate synthetase [Candidatus Blochmannia floridanus]
MILSQFDQNIQPLSSAILPRHIAIIMDGNGRWARGRGKLRIVGHQAGFQAARRAVRFAVHCRFNALTLYAFSSENWTRSNTEISSLMQLFIYALNSEINNLNKNNIKLRIIGDVNRFTQELQDCIYRSEQLTSNNNGLNLNIAANYGGRWDIVQGVKKIIAQIQKGVLKPNQINENILCKYVCMNELSPVDLVIRTGGEHRISNFLLWQIAYAELFFTDVLWPDFNDIVFRRALHSFMKRDRRFGKSAFI